jgi:hypothetical protein
MNAQTLFDQEVARIKAYRDAVLLARDRARQANLHVENCRPRTWGEACVVPNMGRESGQPSNKERV